MRYFTRGWATGELDDDETEGAGQAYQRRLEAIAGRLPAAARTLAHEVQLHDALVERVRWRPGAQVLTLTLVTCGHAGECQTVELAYVGALLGEHRLETLRAVARDRDTELLYDEVDIDDDGLLSHRLLFWPRDELTIDCQELRVEVTPRADRRVTLAGAFVVEDER